MSSLFPVSVLDVDRQSGRAPILLADASGDGPHWAAEHREALRAVVAEHGSVLVRGLDLRDAAEISTVFRRLSTGLMIEREAFARRQVYTDGVYSSATWPAKQPMCMHHELSYTLEFPGLLMFACLSAPTEGGATAVSDSPTVLSALPAELVMRFERDGWMLTRSYNDEIGATLAEAFGTEDRSAVESYCRANAIGFEWQPDGGLRTWQRRSAVVHHPVTGQRCWFNQIAFLNEWTIDPEVREYLVDMYGADGLPFNTRYGNGEPIGEDVIQLLNQIYEENTVREPWQPGDLMLVDNIRTAHSREPYEGPREILVGMAEPVRLSARPCDGRMSTIRPTSAGSAISDQLTVPPFAVISGGQVQGVLGGQEKEIVELVEATYRLHGAGDSVNPPSYFLRFPDRPTSRIIALPASIGGPTRVDGLKWISSFPGNVAAGVPRASAVLILNDHDTGYPFACLEASIISATRTAASAALAADWLSRGRPRPTRVGFVGAGLIARYIHTFLAGTGWSFDEVGVHDLSTRQCGGVPPVSGAVRHHRPGLTVYDSAEELIRSSDLVVFATVAAEPHIREVSWFAHHPVVLHVSLRDLAPQILLASTNVVDDVEHCLKADTSPHLVEQLTGNRDFLGGTLDEVMAGRVSVPADQPVVFSPFGLGVLDLAVGKYVYDKVVSSGELHVIDDFFHELRRHG